MEELIRQLNDKGEVVFKAQGYSMQPMLVPNKNVVAIKTIDRPLKKYDVVLFKYNDKYALHRIVKVKDGSYTMCGDFRINCEDNVDRKQIYGILDRFIRNTQHNKDKWIDVDSLLYRLYSRFVVLSKPVRDIMLKLYIDYVGKERVI